MPTHKKQKSEQVMSSATIASTTQPLSDILPWGSPLTVTSDVVKNGGDVNTANNNIIVDNRTLLITDSVANDGRFLLHTLGLQFLSSRYTLDSNDPNDDDSFATLEGAVLWISCGSITEKQIMMGLRKGMQHNLGGGGGGTAGPASSWTTGKGGSSDNSSGGSSGRINIVSIPLELADIALSTGNETSNEEYLKQLYKRIGHWLKHRELLSMASPQQKSNGHPHYGPNLIIIDNATNLVPMFGDRLANAFLSSVRSLMKKQSRKKMIPVSNTANNTPCTIITNINLLAIRASSPDDGGLYQIDDNESSLKGEKLRSEYARLLRPWLGFGSGMSSSSTNTDGDDVGTNIIQIEEQCNYLSLNPHSIPSIVYTSGLYEVADGIVDVSPLESGYARDVLGRLSFVACGKGWWGITGGGRSSGSGNTTKKGDDIASAYTSICVNYRCDDSGARVMRLRR